MDNPTFVLGFVKIVERHPVLYDQKLPHRTPHLCSLTWEKVAEEVRNELQENCAVDDLKAKWKGIRSSYARFKRKIEQCKDGTKQYSMIQSLPGALDDNQGSDVEDWDSELSMQMLNENPNSNKHYSLSSSNSIAMPVCIGNNLVLNSSVKIEPIDEDQHVDTTDITNDDNQLGTENKYELKRKEPMDIFEATTAKIQKTEENADLQFFKSILPDIDHFTKSEKRKFKMGVLKLIDDIENNR
ncbi:uncharacterized protein LOC133520318 [Cydia pomonella]|uniref:uncharacterized protein LOC133520318 n=1 Tax=Cydia pomonella TaxID=82600 RepID=UPI002ADD3CC1|nr:uncharacterized protein LOC133520318 [Cydia pomonella]